MSIVAKVDQSRTNLDLQALDLTWDVEVWTKGGNLLGSIAGSALSDAHDLGPSRAGSALAGAMVGAGAAASLASTFPFFANPAGLILGGVVGGLAGLLS